MKALYRAYRPERFEDVVGQRSVVRTLHNAIRSERVAHAYLFTGPKGTGKTTMAKLLAKAMNCEQGPTTEPCGTCEACVAIARGTSVTVAEIDAASNNRVDDVREKIIDTVAFPPNQGTRRVYILDEAHMLTVQAFNALLKTIEEPPAHVLFVFCTTEAHKMMATVRDRCQHLTFAPPGIDDLMTVLTRAASAENIQADETALRAVARLATGSFRNALGTLEQVATAFDGTFTAQDVVTHMGVFAEDRVAALVEAAAGGDVAGVLTSVEQFAQEGSDLESLAYSAAEYLRALLLAGAGVDLVAEAVADVERARSIAQAADHQRLLATIDCLSDALARMRVGADPRLALESALVRAAQGLGLPSLALRLARLEHAAGLGIGTPVEAPSAPTQAAPAKPAEPAAKPSATAAPQAPSTQSAAKPDADPAPRPDAGNIHTSVGELWAAVCSNLTANPPAHAAATGAQPVSFDGTILVVRSQTPGLLTTGRIGEAIEQAAATAAGTRVAIRAEAGAPSPGEPVPEGHGAPPAATSPQASTSSDEAPREGIEAIQRTFAARELR